MVTAKHTTKQESTRDGTIGIRMRIDRDMHARLDQLRRRFPMPPKINEQARRCLALGIEAEELGGNEPMLDARISEKVKAQMEQVKKEIKEMLNDFLKEQKQPTKKGRGKT